MKEVRRRKERSDKKVDVKPTVPTSLFNCISDLSYALRMPIKDVVEYICIEGMQSRKVIDYISQQFKRDYKFEGTHFYGNNELTHPRYIIRKEKKRARISTRFSSEFYEEISKLSYALDFTPSSTTGFLLEVSVKDITIIDSLTKPYADTMEERQKDAMRKAIRYIRYENPFIQSIGFGDIIRYILHWLKEN